MLCGFLKLFQIMEEGLGFDNGWDEYISKRVKLCVPPFVFLFSFHSPSPSRVGKCISLNFTPVSFPFSDEVLFILNCINKLLKIIKGLKIANWSFL